MADTHTPRQRYLRRWEALKQERSSWLSHWRELSEHILPRKSRFLASDRNRGDKKNGSIINNTPTKAARVLASGMMAGITSPARPWFRLTTPEAALAEYAPVRGWLAAVEERLRTALAKSNVYNVLHGAYLDMGVYGTAPFLLEEDAEDGLRAYPVAVGQYTLANSGRLAVDTLARECSLTVAQAVEKFGLEACSPRVRELHQRGNLDTWLEVLHVIEPNRGYREGMLGPAGQRWRSCWLEVAGDDATGLLREGGYEELPFVAPRWDVTGEDVYGSSPAMDALGDCKALQLLERRKAQAADKVVSPPMRGPAALLNQRASILPGDITYADVPQGGQRFEPAMEVPPAAIQVLGLAIDEHERRINSAFYADLWLMLATSDRSNVTAREVAERHEEKMLQLGPVMERLQDELLDPLVDRAFAILLRQGQLPEPPEELQGQPLRVEYLSIMSQAQKMLGTSAVERLAGFVGNLAAAKPDVLDKVDFDEAVDVYADMLGVPPSIVADDERVAQMRQARAQQQQAQAQAQAMMTAAQGAQTLSKADMEGDNALTRLVGGLGGAAAAAAGGGQ